MKPDNKTNLYSNAHNSFIDKIVRKKREEILRVIKENIPLENINNVIDVGTTRDTSNVSSNYIINNLGNFKDIKSISTQKIESNFFSEKIHKSITDEFSESEINNLKSDLIISNATIEHVGSFENQIKMCSNMIKLSNKYFVICTPNKFYPIELHTKIPFLHFLPNNIYRFILNKIGLSFFSKEENLNLLSIKNLIEIMSILNHQNFKIKYVNLMFFKSNLILIGNK